MMILEMINEIQEYLWGSKDFIPKLLNNHPDGNPKAELWIGAHPKAPSNVIVNEEQKTLLDLIRAEPEKMLGADVSNKFKAQLPFLLKVLSAAQPLSIQSHPNLSQAEEGFCKENKFGIPITAFQRNYKDSNHKPELICAITNFDVMCGFQPIDEIFDRIKYLQLNEILPKAEEITSKFSQIAFKVFFLSMMRINKNRQREIVEQVADKVRNTPSRNEKEELIFYWIKEFSQIYPGDIGVISPLYLNVIKLKPGQALFLEAGTLHAYLHGSGIEIMANSDNVLRCGLTPKNIDVSELMKILKFDHKAHDIIHPKRVSTSELIYKTTADEFQLSIIELQNSFYVENINGPEIILCTEGKAQINNIKLNKGKSIFIPYSTKNYTLQGEGVFYRAVVPN